MTCQWCVHYRRRGGISLCFATKDDDGKPSRISGMACRMFDPRKICTTCEHRCPQEYRDEIAQSPKGCPKWQLRTLSSWGGARRGRRKRPDGLYGKTTQEGVTT